MNRYILVLSLGICSIIAKGQNENPFSQFGYEAPVMPDKQPLSEEIPVFIVPNSDSSSNISFLSIDVKKRLISLHSKEGEIIDTDTLLSYTTARWLTPDPAGQYHSPYLGMGNNPVNGVDPDGAWWYTDNTTGDQVWKSGFFGNLGGIFSSRYSLNTGTITDAGGSHFIVGNVYNLDGQMLYMPHDGVTVTGFRGLNWMGIARGELGQTEVLGTSRNNPRIMEYLHTTGSWWQNDETPWCAAFVNWTTQNSGNGGTNSARALDWQNYGQSLNNPAYGSIGVMTRTGGGHVGFVAGQTANGDIVLLGGNQNNSVSFATYPRSRFVGFRYPNGRNPNYNLPVLNVNNSATMQ